MQKLGDTIITDLGMDLLSSVNNGDDKITYTKTVLAADDLTQESDVDIQKTTSLKLIQQTTRTTVISRVDDTVNLGATFTNKEVTQDFDFYVIGWYAKGSAVITDERLFAITPSTVKQTMPAGKDGAATAAISPKYATALSRSATVSLNPDQAGTVTPEYVDQKIQQIISEGIVNGGSTLSESDNLDSFITTGYHLIKGSLPLNAPEGFSTNGQIIVYGNKDTTDGVTQLAYDDINGTVYVRSYNPTNNKWAEWDLVITKSQLNAVLPTDIARTGENNDFKGKNTFETDPVDKNGDAYGLAKDIATKVTDNGDNSIEINKQAVTPVRDNKNGSINFNSKDMTPADDSAVVHTTGDETINGQKKFKTDPTDGAGNAYAKTVDVNQQLDKKVNVADMRKPASDVAGIEEVNAKQDAIGYTPADDSTVLHNNSLNRITTDDSGIIVGNEGNFGIIKRSGSPAGIAIGLGKNFRFMVTNDAVLNSNSVYHDVWNIAPTGQISILNGAYFTPADDSKVVHTADTSNWQKRAMFNPESYMIKSTLSAQLDFKTLLTTKFSDAGIYYIRDDYNNSVSVVDSVVICEGNSWWYAYGVDYAGNFVHRKITGSTGSYDSGWVINADDSKVAHLSGANNFDTVPTVKNNPLLLASSLPSDLARTGSDQEFTGNNTFDTAPIDKATGNPYITKDGVPSDVARTGQDANFTAGLQKGGIDVATAADLKSVENSAWHQLSMPDCDGMRGITLLYRNFISDHYMNLYAYGTAIPSSIKGPTMLDLSSLVDNIESVSGMARDLTVRMSSSIFRDSSGEETLVDLVASGNKLTLGTNVTIFTGGPVQINGHDSPFAKVNYDNWIGS